MGEGEKQGLAAVLGELAPQERAVAPEPEQLGLLGEDEAEEIEGSPLDQALDRMAEGFARPRRRAGRPKGAKGRRTEAWANLLLGTRRSPLLVLADFYSMPVEELAVRLQCDRLEAAKLQLAAARELAPYVHQKLPQAIQVDKEALPTLILHQPAAGGQTVVVKPGLGAVLGPILDLTKDGE